MIPLSDIISRIRARHEHTSTTRWSDARIQDLINEGLEDLAETTGFYERYCTIPLRANTQWYDLRGFTPETVVRIKSVWSTNRNEFLAPVSPTELEYNWEDATGEPLTYFTMGIHHLCVYPYPTSASGNLRVYFAGIPQRYTYSQAVLRDLPDSYIPALEDYACYEMALLDREPQKALRFWRSYMERQDSLKKRVEGRATFGSSGRIGGMPLMVR